MGICWLEQRVLSLTYSNTHPAVSGKKKKKSHSSMKTAHLIVFLIKTRLKNVSAGY